MKDKTAARKAKALAKLNKTTSEAIEHYELDDWYYDMSTNRYWNVKQLRSYDKEQVSNSIPKSLWTVATPPPDDEAEKKRGRPPKIKQIEPWKELDRIEAKRWVHQHIWAPGYPRIIHDLIVTDVDLAPHKGQRIFNTYRPFTVPPAPKGSSPDRWIELVKTLFPEKEVHEHFFDYCAHMIQRPEEKVNHAILICGDQGVGKDTILKPLRASAGADNVQDITPNDLFGSFNYKMKAVMLTLNEISATDEHRATDIYAALKPLITVPPKMISVNQKYRDPQPVLNVLRIFITTNHPESFFLPPDDRRVFVMRTEATPGWNPPAFFEEFEEYLFHKGGNEAVGQWLMKRDIKSFKPKRPPAMTEGKRYIFGTWVAPDDIVKTAIGSILNEPKVVFTSELARLQFDDADDLRRMLKSKFFLHRMRELGYTQHKPHQTRWEFTPEKENSAMTEPFKPTRVYVNRKAMTKDEDEDELVASRGQRIANVGLAAWVERPAERKRYEDEAKRARLRVV